MKSSCSLKVIDNLVIMENLSFKMPVLFKQNVKVFLTCLGIVSTIAFSLFHSRVFLILFFSSGPEPTLFGKPKFSCMRLHYKYKDTSGYFHTLRAVVRNPDEDGKGLFLV